MMLQVVPKSRLTGYLTYMGTLPFIASALLIIMGFEKLPMLGSVHTVLTSYGLVILVFMAGVHWGQHIERNDKWQSYLSVLSTAMAIVAWCCYLLLPFKAFVACLLLFFMVLIYVDKQLCTHRVISKHYFRTRCFVTLIVCFSLILALSA